MNKLCFSVLVHPYLNMNSQWTQTGVTVAGGHGKGNAFNQIDISIHIENKLFSQKAKRKNKTQ